MSLLKSCSPFLWFSAYVISSCKYCFAGTCVCFMWCAVLVMMCHVPVTCILYDLLLGSLVPCLPTALCIQGPPSSLCTTTANSTGIMIKYLPVYTLISPVLPQFQGIIMFIIIIMSYWHSVYFREKSLIGLLNSIVAGLDCIFPIDVNNIWINLA